MNTQTKSPIDTAAPSCYGAFVDTDRSRTSTRVCIVNPPNAARIVMVKEGRCMQRQDAWGYVMAPVTMVTMGTKLRDCGHTVSVLDATVSANDVDLALRLVAEGQPRIVFINTSTPTIDDDLAFAAALKRRMGDSVVTALFGIHPSVMYADLLGREPSLDFCVLGEPELTALELTDAVASGGDCSSVAGLAWLEQGVARCSAVRPYIDDLDILPAPDWSLVNPHGYRLPFGGPPFLLVNTNRGCPYFCTFCNAHVYYGRAPRKHSIAHLMKELHQNVERFGVRDFMVWAEEFMLDKEFVSGLADAIVADGLSIRWVCNSRVNGVDRRVLEKIRRAGCWNVAFGIESGVQSILDGVRKGITLQQTRDAVALCKEVGLKVTGHVILGLPGETEETMAQTHRFVRELDLDYVQFYCAMPAPGTALRDLALAEGWVQPADWQRFEHNYSVMEYPQLSSHQVMDARRKYFLRYYMQPKIARAVVKNHLTSARDLGAFTVTLKGFLSWVLEH